MLSNGSPADNFHDPVSAQVEAVVAGHICLDIIPTLTQPGFKFSPGKLVEAGEAVMSTGGSVANTGLCLNRLGVKTALLGKVGDDLFADTIRRILDSQGDRLSNELIVSPGEQTSYSIIISPPGADRMFLHAPGCNATFNENDINFSTLTDIRLFHFGYPPLMQQTYLNGGASLISIMRQAKEAGPTTSVDMSLPDLDGPSGAVDWLALLMSVLPFVDIFTPSIDEILLMLEPDIYCRSLSQVKGALISPELLRSLGDKIIAMGAAFALIKLGDQGLYLHTASPDRLSQMGCASPKNLHLWADIELWTPCFVADEIGTTGSGDATVAGFLTGFLRGMSAEDCMTAATAVGASSVESADSNSGVKDWKTTKSRIDSGWPKHKLNVSAPGWKWDDQYNIWRCN